MLFRSEVPSDSITWSHIPQIWGWASTRLKWNQIRNAVLSFNPPLFYLKRLDLNFWLAGVKRVFRGQIDTWDIPVVLCFILNQKFAIHPPCNLVTNIGFDDMASNTREAKFPLGIPLSILPTNLTWTSNPRTNEVENYRKLLNTKVYGIHLRHFLSPIIYQILDMRRRLVSGEYGSFKQKWRQIAISKSH